jgi:hypothetical protein
VCGNVGSNNCPGSYNTTGTITVGNETAFFNASIPANITEVFSSLTAINGSTLSGPWDIQYRQLNLHEEYGITYAIGAFRSLDMLILHDKVEPVEGLIVDSINGSIGLRNHTIPTGLEYGGTWKEDITWIALKTECVDTNITLHYMVDLSGYTDLGQTDTYFVDNGGFVNLARSYPQYSSNSPQSNPDLRGRAYAGAWLSNAYFMLYMNMTTLDASTNLSDPISTRLSTSTDSFLGKRFNLSNFTTHQQPNAGAIALSQLGDSYIFENYTSTDSLTIRNYTLFNPGQLYPKNPSISELRN